MLSSIFISLVVMAAVQQPAAPTTVQKSSGWCSPNIANVVGNVTVNCIGVDPRALNRLNAQLSSKNLQLADKIREADEWTTRYKELETQLSAAGDDSVLSRQAEEYLRQGELEKAEATLKQLVNSGKKTVDAVAAHNYQLALVLELQFRPVEALPYLEEAYQLRPKEWKYGQEYASVLLDQNDYTRAEPVLLATLDNARLLAKTNPATYQPDVARTLNNLGELYRVTQRMKEAEAAYQEALDIRRQLAKTNPAAYQPDVAGTLNNLALLYAATQRMKEAEAAYQEALDIRRQLARTNPAAYQSGVAQTLNNLANFYSDTQRMEKAEAAYQEALDIYRQLAKTNPAAYQPYVAGTLNNLALLYAATQRMEKAEAAYQEALEIYRQLAKTNPAAYQPYVAVTLNNVGLLYSDTQRPKAADTAFQGALDIFRQLAKPNPAAYQPGVAQTLNNLALLHMATNNPQQALKEVEEAISINRERWKVNPTVAADDLANSLIIASSAQQESSAKCQLTREAARVAQDPQLRDRANKLLSTCPPP